MTMRRWITIWLKRRKNPPRKDGSGSISYTFQWRDLNDEERFRSLGSKLTKAEAEEKRDEFEERINVGWGDDAERLVEQLQLRNRRYFDALAKIFGSDPRRWDIQELGVEPSGWYEALCQRAEVLLSSGADDPLLLHRQFMVQHESEYHVLLDYFGANEAFRMEIAKRLVFHGPEKVETQLLELAAQWTWSDNPKRFVEQFRSRHPQEYEAVINEDIDMERQFSEASKTPAEVADRLLRFARGNLDMREVEDDLPPDGRSVVPESEMD